MSVETTGNIAKILEETALKVTNRYEESILTIYTAFDRLFTRRAAIANTEKEIELRELESSRVDNTDTGGGV